MPDRNAYVISEIAWVIFSATDMIILSVFVSTALSSVYSIYSMVFSSLSMLLNSVYTSINYNLGQTFHMNINEYEKKHDLYNSIFVSAITILVSTAYFLILPFVNLYTQGVMDINYMYGSLPLFFCLIQLLSWSRYVTGNLTGIAGYAKPVSHISMVEAIINIVCSIALVQKFGVVGVVMATVIALPIKVVYCTYISDVKIMGRKCWNSIRIFALNYSMFFAFAVISKFVSFKINSYFSFFVHGVCVVAIVSSIIIGANLLFNYKYFTPLTTKIKNRRS